jgi:hypothetical protein
MERFEGRFFFCSATVATLLVMNFVFLILNLRKVDVRKHVNI